MTRVVKTFPDGSSLEFDSGQFDDWCVYLRGPNGVRLPPRDLDYFQQLRDLADKYGRNRVYTSFVTVYELTKKDVEGFVLEYITQLAKFYGEDALMADILFSTLYLAMIAEENKAYTRLGKRIKRLGVYKLLLEDCDPSTAANFMRDMDWTEIDSLCRAHGF